MTGALRTSGIPMRRLSIAVVMAMVSTLPVFLAGASFLQLSRDIGLTAIGLGAITAAFFLTASITSTPLGRLVERIGWRRAMRINCVVSAIVVVLIALLARSPLTLGALLVVSGLVYGFTNPAANQALARRTPQDRRGIVFGLKHAGIPASTLVAGAAVPLLVLTVGWRPTFALSSVLALVAWLLIRSEPVGGTSDSPSPRQDTTGVGQPLNRAQLLTLALGAAFATWAAVFLGTFLVAGAVEASFSESEAGVILFAGSLVSITARVVYGMTADRRRAAGLTGVALIMGLGSLVFIGLSGAGGIGFVVAVLAAFALGWGWPGLMTFAVVNANATTAASSSAVTQAGIFLGAGLGPVALGWIVDNRSFHDAWLTVAIFLALAALVVGGVALKRHTPRVAPQES